MVSFLLRTVAIAVQVTHALDGDPSTGDPALEVRRKQVTGDEEDEEARLCFAFGKGLGYGWSKKEPEQEQVRYFNIGSSYSFMLLQFLFSLLLLTTIFQMV